MMRELGERMLRHLKPGFRKAEYVESLEAIDFASVNRLLFAFSYVSHQDTVTTSDIEQWATVIRRAVAQTGRAVELIYTTAALSRGALPRLGEELEQAGIRRRTKQVRVQVHARYPAEGAEQSVVEWDNTGWAWKVQAQHWILRA